MLRCNRFKWKQNKYYIIRIMLGTADIVFKNDFLRIHDLKTGVTAVP